jgi:hypothetical protein
MQPIRGETAREFLSRLRDQIAAAREAAKENAEDLDGGEVGALGTAVNLIEEVLKRDDLDEPMVQRPAPGLDEEAYPPVKREGLGKALRYWSLLALGLLVLLEAAGAAGVLLMPEGAGQFGGRFRAVTFAMAAAWFLCVMLMALLLGLSSAGLYFHGRWRRRRSASASLAAQDEEITRNCGAKVSSDGTSQFR